MKLTLERPQLISLAAGFTDNATLPAEEVNRITREILRRPKTAQSALQYGTTIGLPQLRRELLGRWQQQDRYVRQRSPVTSDHIVVTNGSQQLLYLVTEVLCDPGDIVLVEDPTYFVYLGIVQAMGLRPFGFDSVAALESKLEHLKRQRLLPRLKLLYLITYFQNPTGRTWSLEDKREAMAVVRRYERAAGHPIYIVEDAAYRDMRLEGKDVPSFKMLDPRNERVVYANTLTKPFATGIKIGYGILPAALMRAVLNSKGNHDFGSSNFLQAILARALATGVYERHLAAVAAAYRLKRDAMIQALDRFLSTSIRYHQPRGGLYIWLELDAGTRTGASSKLFRRALDAGVLYVPGEMCFCNDPTRPIPRNCIRLSFGAPGPKQIRQGIKLLADSI